MAEEPACSHGGTYVTANGDGRPLLSRDYTVKRVDDWWALRVQNHVSHGRVVFRRALLRAVAWEPCQLAAGAIGSPSRVAPSAAKPSRFRLLADPLTLGVGHEFPEGVERIGSRHPHRGDACSRVHVSRARLDALRAASRQLPAGRAVRDPRWPWTHLLQRNHMSPQPNVNSVPDGHVLTVPPEATDSSRRVRTVVSCAEISRYVPRAGPSYRPSRPRKRATPAVPQARAPRAAS